MKCIQAYLFQLEKQHVLISHAHKQTHIKEKSLIPSSAKRGKTPLNLVNLKSSKPTFCR